MIACLGPDGRSRFNHLLFRRDCRTSWRLTCSGLMVAICGVSVDRTQGYTQTHRSQQRSHPVRRAHRGPRRRILPRCVQDRRHRCEMASRHLPGRWRNNQLAADQESALLEWPQRTVGRSRRRSKCSEQSIHNPTVIRVSDRQTKDLITIKENIHALTMAEFSGSLLPSSLKPTGGNHESSSPPCFDSSRGFLCDACRRWSL